MTAARRLERGDQKVQTSHSKSREIIYNLMTTAKTAVECTGKWLRE